MKNLVTIALVAAALTSVAPQAQANNIAQNLCEYVAVDDKKRLRSFLKTNKLKIRTVFKGVQCNGKNLLTFADSRGSEQSAILIIAKLPKKLVKANIGSLTNATIKSAATKRIG